MLFRMSFSDAIRWAPLDYVWFYVRSLDVSSIQSENENTKSCCLGERKSILPVNKWRHRSCWHYRSCLHTLNSSICRSKNEFCTKESPWSFSTRYLTTGKSATSVSLYDTCPVVFWLLSALKKSQDPRHQRHIRCLSGVWSGTTLCRTSVQLSKPSDATQSGTALPRSQTSSTWTTDDKRWGHNNKPVNNSLQRPLLSSSSWITDIFDVHD